MCFEDKKELLQAIQQLEDREVIANMKKVQHEMVDPLVVEKIVNFIEEIV